MTLWRLEGDTLPQESQGQIVPEYYGDLHRDVAALPLQVGYAVILADNCGADETQITLKVSSPNLDKIRDDITLPRMLQLDEEWMLLTAISENPWTFTVTRARSGTVAAKHAKGSTIIFLESKPIYVVASSPPGCRYPDDAIIQVRINDVAQTPPCTIRLQDSRIIDGARLVTIEFDLSRMFGAVDPPPAAQTLVLDRPMLSKSTIKSYEASLPLVKRGDFLTTYAASGDATRVLGLGGIGASGRGAQGYMSGGLSNVPHYWGIYTLPPRTAETVASIIQGTSGPIRALSSPLGRVTVDIKGLLDTTDGRFGSGSSGQMIEPCSQMLCILENTYGETRHQEESWTKARARHAALSVTWRIAWRGDNFDSFRVVAGYCGLGDLWIDDDGLWRFSIADRTAAAVAVLTPREIVSEVILGFIPPSATKLAVSWGTDLDTGSFTLDSEDMIERFNIVTDRLLSLPFIATEAAARLVAREWMTKWDRDRWTAAVSVAPAMAALTRTDRVMLDTALLNVYGRQRVPWEIRGTVENGDRRTLTLVEGDAIALEFSWALSVRSTAIVGAAGGVGTMVGGLYAPTSVTFNGAVLALLSTTGDLKVPVPISMSGAVVATLMSTGVLWTQAIVLLGGFLSSLALLGGSINGGLQGGALASAAMDGAIYVLIPLTGSLGGTAVMSGSAFITVQFSGDATGMALLYGEFPVSDGSDFLLLEESE